ncbi:MAG TPA: hypothetical protein VMB50_14420 [Myxococcales bacterium]|nr:hypothetical protein [Myxococcales bacterium]
MTSFTLTPRGPFSMDPVRDLSCGFLQGSRRCGADPGSARLAFPRDGDFAVVGVALRWDGERLHGRVEGAADPETLRAQVARTLCLDHDGAEFARLLERDPVLRRVAAGRPGFRPVVAYSPYVMGGWAILSQRLRMTQAASLQVRIAEAAGDVIAVDGEPLTSFPRPQSLLARPAFPGVPAEKWRRLQGLAAAALDGELDLARLMSEPYQEARERLMRLRGVGPWTADAILMRGCGHTDLLPLSEPSLHRAVAAGYGLARIPDDEAVRELAEGWRPFRTWVSVLLISASGRGPRSGSRRSQPAGFAPRAA